MSESAQKGQTGGFLERFLPHQKRLKIVGRLLFGLTGVVLFTLILFLFTLPSVSKVTDYRPPLTTRIFSADLEPIGEFAKEYRLLMELRNIPKVVQQAFIAAEDNRFYDHKGVDYLGILRAMVKNLQSGSVKQGGSTITQQVAKSLLLSPERTITRKIREALLAFMIESKLTKDEILYLYLNQIYLGHGAYGVAAGARVYFNKDLNQLNLAETALLAGMPTAPSRDNPFKNPERALARRAYVLKAMEEMGFINQAERTQAENLPVALDDRNKDLNKTAAPHFSEHIRRIIAEKYGEVLLYEGGLKVYTSLALPLQAAAIEAVRWNLHELDRRQGYRGPLKHLEEAELTATLKAWDEKAKSAGSKAMAQPTLELPAIGEEAYRAEKLTALVTEVNSKKNRLKVQTENSSGWIPLALMKWARKPDPEVTLDEAPVTRVDSVLHRGDQILVRAADLSELPKEQQSEYMDLKDLRLFALDQEPEVEGAILAVNPGNGFVQAMVGGYDFSRSEFNRAVQAKRQPGSAFKPFIYAAALDKGYTPATLILDAPIVFDDPVNDTVWRPKNYSGTFQGDIPFRTALIESRNVVTVKILQDIGIDYVIDYAKKFGIESSLTRDNTLALGSSVLTPLELTFAYNIFATGGVKREAVFIKKIVDRDGKELERHTFDDPAVDMTVQLQKEHNDLMATIIEPITIIDAAPAATTSSDQAAAPAETSAPPATPMPEMIGPPATAPTNVKLRVTRPAQMISEETAFVATHLLNEVVTYGTGYRARELKRPAAGKTGTTNEHVDAWFVGFTPDLLSTAWVGFDDARKTLGRLETGARAALPMWLKFMNVALEGRPPKAFRPPAGIVFVKIDPATGKLANEKTERPVLEAFRDGTQPQANIEDTGATKDFFLEE